MTEAHTPPGGARDEGAAGHQVRHSIGRNLSAMASSQVISWILATVAQLVLPRFLGPEGLGRLQLAFSLWLIAQVLVGLGTGTYLTLEIARDRERGLRLIGPIMVLRVIAFVVASVALAAYALAVGFDREMQLLLAITGVTMLFGILQDTMIATYVGLEQVSRASIAAVAAKLIYTVLLLVVLSGGGGVVAAAWLTTVQSVVALAMLVVLYRRFGRLTFDWPADGVVAILRGSFVYMVGGIVLTVYMQIDMVVMSLLVNDEALGWYASADVLVASMLIVPTMMTVVLFPVLGRLHLTDAAGANRIVRQAFWALTITGVAIGFGLAVIGEPFAVLTFGEDFRQAGHVLSVFGFALPLIFLTTLLGQVAYATGRERFWTTIMSIAVVTSIAFDIVFVPIMDRVAGNGAIAGALGYVVTEAFMVVVAIRRITPELFSAATVTRISKILVAGAVMFAAAWPLRDRLLVIPVVVGAVVFPAVILAFGTMNDEDRDLIGRLSGEIRARLAR